MKWRKKLIKITFFKYSGLITNSSEGSRSYHTFLPLYLRGRGVSRFQKSILREIWKSPNYFQGDLVFRGCMFCRVEGGFRPLRKVWVWHLGWCPSQNLWNQLVHYFNYRKMCICKNANYLINWVVTVRKVAVLL